MSTLRVRFCVCVLNALIVLGASRVYAQGSAPKPRTLDDYYIDFAVPDFPALTLLGFTPNKISRPGTLKELSVSFLTLANDVSTISPGLAVAWAPIQTFRPRSVDDYKKDFLRRLALSFATAKQSSGTDVGMGVRLMWMDHADPVFSSEFDKILNSVDNIVVNNTIARQAFFTSVEPFINDLISSRTKDPNVKDQMLASLLDPDWNIEAPPNPPTVESQTVRVHQHFDTLAKQQGLKGLDAAEVGAVRLLAGRYLEASFARPPVRLNVLVEAKKQYREQHWNAAAAQMDFGYAASSGDSTWSQLKSKSLGGLVSGTVPLGPSGQLVGQVHVRGRVGTQSGERRFVSAGGRVLFGSSTKRLSAEALLASTLTTAASSSERTSRVTVGTELRLTEGLWLEVALGSESRIGANGSSMLSVAGVKYAFRQEPRFPTVPGATR
jgi:hypothetical protein